MNTEQNVSFGNLDRIFAEQDQRLKKSQAEADHRQAEADRRMKEMDRQFRESRDEFDRRQAESDRRVAELWRMCEETDRRTNRKLESLGIVQGEVAEDLFRRNVKSLLEQENIRVGQIIYHMKESETREYDIVAVNGTEVVVFEIKNKLRSQDIKRFLTVQLPQFKEGFPKYKDYKVYGGLGALVVNKSLEQEVRAKGLFLLTQGQDGNARLHRPKHLKIC